MYSFTPNFLITMKKILFYLTLSLSAFFFISCGGRSSKTTSELEVSDYSSDYDSGTNTPLNPSETVLTDDEVVSKLIDEYQQLINTLQSLINQFKKGKFTSSELERLDDLVDKSYDIEDKLDNLTIPSRLLSRYEKLCDQFDRLDDSVEDLADQLDNIIDDLDDDFDW